MPQQHHTGVLDFSSIRAEFELNPRFPAQAQAEAENAHDRFADGRADRRDLELVTIDPPGSKDLDQAMHIAHDPSGDGYLVSYAIADVGALVVPGGALDDQTRLRGQTVYLPDGSVPLHPPALSEGAGSLLPDQDRPAALWQIRLDGRGEVSAATVARATVRSRARLDYAGVQADFDGGRVHPSIALLPEVGKLRQQWGRAHNAVDLRLPAQEAVRGPDGWSLRFEHRTDFDDYNEQISLLTGVCAAAIMLQAGVGLLRTLPTAPDDAIAALRRTAASLGQAWPADMGVGDFLAGIDVTDPRGLATMSDAGRLLRGAGYAAFGTPEHPHAPQDDSHAGVGAPYAHVTAPLRRLADRYATEICLAVCAKTDRPQWAVDALEPGAQIMQTTNTVANKVDRACIDLTEAVVLDGHQGEEFEAVVMRDDQVLLDDPPVIARCGGKPPEGERVRVRLEAVDVATRTVRLQYESTPK